MSAINGTCVQIRTRFKNQGILASIQVTSEFVRAEKDLPTELRETHSAKSQGAVYQVFLWSSSRRFSSSLYSSTMASPSSGMGLIGNS